MNHRYTIADHSIEEHDEAVLKVSWARGYYQSSYYAEQNIVAGFTKYIFVDITDDEGDLVATNMMMLKKIPVINGWYGYSRFGFALDYNREGWQELAGMLWNEFVKLAKKEKVIYYKFDICVPDDRTEVFEFYKKKKARHAGLVQSNEPYTYFRFRSEMDITPDEKTLLKNMSRSTKWKVNRSKKFSYVLEKGGMELYPEFRKVHQTAAERDGFGIMSYEDEKLSIIPSLNSGGAIYMVKLNIEETLKVCEQEVATLERKLEKELTRGEEGRENLINDIENSIVKAKSRVEELRAYEKDNPNGIYLSGCLSLRHGEILEYYRAGSSNDLRDFYPTYYLIWKLIEDGKADGAKMLDLGGTFPDSDTGLQQFKTRWNAKTVGYSGDFNYVVNKITGSIFKKMHDKRFANMKANC